MFLLRSFIAFTLLIGFTGLKAGHTENQPTPAKGLQILENSVVLFSGNAQAIKVFDLKNIDANQVFQMTGINEENEIRITNIFPQIDLLIYTEKIGNENEVVYAYELFPGANPADIQWDCQVGETPDLRATQVIGGISEREVKVEWEKGDKSPVLKLGDHEQALVLTLSLRLPVNEDQARIGFAINE